MKKFIIALSVVLGLVGITSCGGDDEPDTKFKDAEVEYGKTYTIPKGNNIEWTSANEYIATVSGATVTGVRVGTTQISSDKGRFNITVTPTSHVFKVPCLDWGCGKSTVKSFMSGYSIKEETTTQISYSGSGAVIMYLYNFENNGLKGSSLALDGDYVSTDAMSQFMVERYIPVKYDSSDYSFYFVSPDEKSVILMQLTTSGSSIYYIIVYVPTDSKSRAFDLENIKVDEKFNALKQGPSPMLDKAFAEMCEKL